MMTIPTTEEAMTAMMVMVVRGLVAAPPSCGGELLSDEELIELVTVWYSMDGPAEEEGELAGGLDGAGGGGVEVDEELDEKEDEELEELELEETEELMLDGLEAADDGSRPSERPGRPIKGELLDGLFKEADGEEAEGVGLEGGSPATPTAPPSPPLNNPPGMSTGIRFRMMRFTLA